MAELARAAGGQAQVLLITGEAGIGKTRLTEELGALAGSASGGAQVRIGESVPLVGATLAYGPFVAALILGAADTAFKYAAPELGAFFIYALTMGLLLWRPRGILGPA